MSKLTIVSSTVVCAASVLLFADVRWIHRPDCGNRTGAGPVGHVAVGIWIGAGLTLLVAAGIDLARRRWPALGAVGVALLASMVFGVLAFASFPLCGL